MKLVNRLIYFSVKSLYVVFQQLNILRVKLYLESKGIDTQGKRIYSSGKLDLKIKDSARFYISDRVTLSNCSINISGNSELFIGEGSTLNKTKIILSDKSFCRISNDVLIQEIEPFQQHIILKNGHLEIGQGSRIRSSIYVQYGGKVKIGKKTFINEGTEIRSDRSIDIGDFTLISYEVNIFDTNTHSTDWSERRKAILESPPHTVIGEPRPISKPIIIGNDCWIGKRASILKGVIIKDKTIVSLGAVVAHSIPEESIAYGNPIQYKKIQSA